jgi:non-specific serine/threonine protein kinase
MIGHTISHYKILEELGAGGMGVVYKALDTKLKRTVALKFLSPQSLGSKQEQSRFIHEAQAAAALDHSNICTIHEINEAEGKSFIAMAYVDGPSLREEVESGPLDVDRAVDIATQVAEGLREAHEKGIIHRDIKSANIMLTSKGQAKITDFGLAKLPGRTKLTKTGSTVGTLAYMSPEQAQGAEVDHRSDIWSLGVVLYELLSGKVPFKGDHEAAMVYSIMNQDVEPPSDLTPEVPAELDSIVAKMLQKNPDDRYASTEELLSDLRKVQAGAAVKVSLPMSRKAKRVMWGLSAVLVIVVAVTSLIILNRGPSTVSARTLAVVDFDIISGEDADHLAVGLSEGISVKLSKLDGVRVVSSDDIRRLRKKDLSAKEVASQLGAQFALGGSLLKSGEQIRVTPQLIDASSGDVIWSELFDREFSDVFGFLDEISLKIVAALELELEPEERVALEEKPTESAEAYEHYLKGRHFYYSVTFADNELSTKEFQRALQIDPDYPLALAGLADAYVQRYKERYDYDELWVDEADRLIDKALELESDLAEAYESRAEVLFEKENYLGALEAASRARELRPDWDEPYVRLGEIYQRRGEGSSALEMFEQALKIRPSVDAWCGKGNIFQTRGRADSAEAAYRTAINHNPDHERAFFELGRMYAGLHRGEEAEKMLRRAIEVRPDLSRSYKTLTGILFWGPTDSRQEDRQEAEALMRKFIEEYPYQWDGYEALYDFLADDMGDWPAAVKVVEEAATRNPDRVWPQLLMAGSYAYGFDAAAESEKAIAAVEKALKLRPGSGRVLKAAGDVYNALGNPEKALHYYHLALGANPGSATTLTSVAGLLLSQCQYDSAAVVAAKGIEQFPGVTNIYLAWTPYRPLRTALVNLMRADEFLETLRDAAARYGQDNPIFFANLGDEQRVAGQFQEALLSYRRILDIGDESFVLSPSVRQIILKSQGMALWLSGDTEGALASFRKQREWMNWLWERGTISLLKYLGRFDEVAEHLKTVRENDLEQWAYIAWEYYESMRRFEDALAVIAELIESGEMTWKDSNMLDVARLYRQKGDIDKARETLKEAEESSAVFFSPYVYQERALIAAMEGRMSQALQLAEKAVENSSSENHAYYDAFLELLAKLQYADGRTKESLSTLAKANHVWRHTRLPALYRRAQFEMASESADADANLRKALFFATRATRAESFYMNLAKARCFSAVTLARLDDSQRAEDEIEYAIKLEPERADIAYCAAAAYSLIGDTTLALQWLETSVERGHQELWWARVDPDLDNLRDLPRFKEIINDWDRRLRAMIN